MNDMTHAISLMPPPEWDDSVDQTETVRSRLSALRKLEPPEQRRQLLALLQATGSLPRYSREQLEAVMEIDQAWHPIAEELDRDYRRNPLAVTTDPLGFQKGMAALSRAFGDIYAGFARIYGKDPEDAVQGSLKGCIALALFHLGRYARYLYCRNELPSDEFWERMHFLYKLAGERGIAEERLSLFPQHEVVVTCTRLWVQAVMLATAATGNLSPRQLSRAAEWLRSWSEWITFDERYDTSRHSYCVDLDGAQGPQRITPDTSAVNPVYLGTRHLQREILAARAQIVEDSIITTIGWYAENPLNEYFELLDRMQQLWIMAPSSKSQRASARVEGSPGERIEVARGLSDIIALCAGTSSARPRTKSYSVIDRSERGFALKTTDDRENSVNMLDLVAVSATAPCEWKVGVVIRTTLLPSKERLLGVHLLAQTAILVTLTKELNLARARADDLRIVDELARPGPAAKSELALFLVGDTAKNQADSLLAPAGAYVPGDRLRLETPGRTFLIVINRVIQKGAGWERTGFNVEEKLITGSFR